MTSCGQRSATKLYRALEYPLYPILRKIERIGENQQLAVLDAAAHGRVAFASNHRSHIDYLCKILLVLDDAGIRPPIIAAGINLFGGPLGLIHKHVTGAMPIRRNTRIPADPTSRSRRTSPSCCTSTTCSSIEKAGAATAASSRR